MADSQTFARPEPSGSGNALTQPDRREIEAFLYYGFVPRVPENFAQHPWGRPGSSGADEGHSIEAGAAERVARGIEILRELCRGSREDQHVVPISGGVDSRVLLQLLVDAGLRDSLVAVTFGLPGTFDYELGAQVARAAGVRHEAIDLRESAPDADRLSAFAAPHEAWIHVFETAFNACIPERFGKDAIYWSGLMANTLNGSRCAATPESWSEACARFASEKRFSRSWNLAAPGFRPEALLPRAPLAPGSRLLPYEELQLAFLYPCRYDPCVLLPGYDYRTPFRDPAWVDFILDAPRPLRIDERLYRRIAVELAPELFRLPTKTNYGAALDAPRWRVQLGRLRTRLPAKLRDRYPSWVRTTPPLLNYLDFDEEFRRAPYRDLVDQQLDDLEQRGVIDWVDFRELRERHAQRRGNHGDALLLLTTLELNLKQSFART